MPQRVSHAALIAFIAAAYRAAGVPAADAEKAAALMAQSDISGADGHGVFRLPAVHPPYPDRRHQRHPEHRRRP